MCLDVDINEDIIGENNEVFTLILTGAQTPDQATVTIIDNGEVLTSIFQHRLLVISLLQILCNFDSTGLSILWMKVLT